MLKKEIIMQRNPILNRLENIIKTGTCDKDCENCPISYECFHDQSRTLSEICSNYIVNYNMIHNK